MPLFFVCSGIIVCVLVLLCVFWYYCACSGIIVCVLVLLNVVSFTWIIVLTLFYVFVSHSCFHNKTSSYKFFLHPNNISDSLVQPVINPGGRGRVFLPTPLQVFKYINTLHHATFLSCETILFIKNH